MEILRPAQIERRSMDIIAGELSERGIVLPEEIRNLVFQIRVKILAEKTRLSAVVKAGSDIVLKFPPLPSSVSKRDLPAVSSRLRVGKNAYHMVGIDWENDDWKDDLIGVLAMLALKLQP